MSFDDGLVDVNDDAFWNDPSLLDFVSPQKPQSTSQRTVPVASNSVASQNSGQNVEYFQAFPDDLDAMFHSPHSSQDSRSTSEHLSQGQSRNNNALKPTSLNFSGGQNYSSSSSSSYHPMSSSTSIPNSNYSSYSSSSSYHPPSSSSTSTSAPKPNQSYNANNRKRKMEGDIRVPLCRGHQLPSNTFICKKETVNKGRKFWCCSVPKPGSCNFFVWDSELAKTKGIVFGHPSGKTPTGEDTVCVTLQLVSEGYFSVDFVPFHQAVVNTLKVQGGTWNAELKLWIFPLRTHDILVQALNQMPDFHLRLNPIPPSVLKLFAAPPPAPEALFDESRLPEKLLQALLPFQLEGLQYVVSRNGRAYIGDEMVRMFLCPFSVLVFLKKVVELFSSSLTFLLCAGSG